MRIKDKKIEIDYKDTKKFFAERSQKYSEEKPYCVTMYQDKNKELVEERNKAEQEKILPLLKLNETSKVIDIGCGIGRWADAINVPIKQYCGTDFSEELIDIAKQRNRKENFVFQNVNALNIRKFVIENNLDKFNRVIIAGVLMYLNDQDVKQIFVDLTQICDQETIIYIREPVNRVDNRLTLKNFYSEELETYYNTIYRSVSEYKKHLAKYMLKVGYTIKEEGFIFESDKLNNRKETSQYYYILERI